MRILLANPPLADPSGPYPSICYLAGYLDTIGYRADLADASLTFLLKVLSRRGMEAAAGEIRGRLDAGALAPDPAVQDFLDRRDWYARTIETAVACLQGRDHGALARAGRRGYFPPPLDASSVWATSTYLNLQIQDAQLGGLTAAQRTRLANSADPLRFAFGAVGGTEETRLRASMTIGDLCRVVRHALDPEFELDAYAVQISDHATSFAPIAARLSATPSLLDRLIDETAAELLARHQVDVLGLTVPFGGSLYGAVRVAAYVKAHQPGVRIILGGGWINTQLRDLSDPAIFDCVDYITLDDGERPLQCLLEWFEGKRSQQDLLRTYRREHGRVVYVNGATDTDVPFLQAGTPTYRGLPLDRYIVFRPSVESFKPIRGRRFNKLTLAHGCYWKKCAFCDTSLDYIGRYEPATVDVTIERIKRLRDETGESGFHFVDEAMPPSLMGRLAERLIAEELSIAWWGNVRFDRALIPLAPLLAESGCISLTGGIEVPSDRLLALMEKGVSLAQAAQVCHALSEADIYTHAYLMYGFPSETAQETIDGLEFVRQMFETGCLRSAFWHWFALTRFSPIAARPDRFGITIRPSETHPFSNYLLDYDEPGAVDAAQFGDGLKRAVQHYALGVGFEGSVSRWFDGQVPEPTLDPDFVRRAIAGRSALMRS